MNKNTKQATIIGSASIGASVLIALLAGRGAPNSAPQNARAGSDARAAAIQSIRCGDPHSSFAGTDHEGTISAGSGAGATCTLTFARRWSSLPVCQIDHGAVAELTEDHITVIIRPGEQISLRCNERTAP